MNAATAALLQKLTSDFYRSNGAAFSATRRAPWPGWSRCLELLRATGNGAAVGSGKSLLGPQAALRPNTGLTAHQTAPWPGERLTVLDLACGNLRFELFLTQALAPVPLTFYAVDNCAALSAPSVSKLHDLHYQNLDLLAAGAPGVAQIQAPPCDLSVCLAFLHHIPLPTAREQVINALVRHTKPGGFIILSFWQFLSDARMAAKAQREHEQALAALSKQGVQLGELSEGDFLLGWDNTPGLYRYCHSFSDTEIDALIEAATAETPPDATTTAQATTTAANHATTLSTVARFTADGRDANQNCYVILHIS